MNQDFYTKLFLKNSDQAVTEENIKLSKRKWWVNTRKKSQGGLRLTDEGLDLVVNILNLQIYEIPFPITLDLKPEVVVFLDRFLDCPFYLTERSITVTNERKCFELHLFAGDVQKYGLIKAMSRQRRLDKKGNEIVDN
jgi:hypothetical protein